MTSFTEQLRASLATLQSWLTAWAEELIHNKRMMWRANGTDVGQVDIVDISATLTKTGNVLAISGTGAGAHGIVSASHTAAGTAGDVLQLTDGTTLALAPITDAMLPATIARDTEVGEAVAAHEIAGDHTQYVLKSVLTTLGDLIVGGAGAAPTRVGIGSDGMVLTADSTQPMPVKWAYPKQSGYILFGTYLTTYQP